ncbi:MAG TPA: hypothetical protein VFX92_02000, partial [Candidatus Krumholzibacteria bacterium]|nr:hypothetical protein [Candidatus Krumholzibacteria bacterium]
TQAGFDSVELLAAAVARRREIDAAIRTRLAMLRDWVPAAAATAAAAGREAFLAACEHEIERVLDDGANAPAFPYEPDAAMRVERELERVTAEEKQTRQRLEQTRRELHRIELRANDLGVVDGPVHCRTTRELDNVRGRIAGFCDTVRRDARLAQEAIRILQDIEAEENEKVGELFGEDTMVSRWFREVTQGRYRAVHLADGEVWVEFADGQRLSASALSGGTFDQLYLAIRTGIAEQMLPDSRGFFILDDPFLKADRERMGSLMNMLRQLVQRGWQVIYVTAKDEVVDALADDIAAGSVRLVELEAPLFVRAAPPLPAPAPRLPGLL